MFVAALIFLLLPNETRIGALGVIVAGVVAVGILVLLTGLGMNIAGRVMRRSAARFVGALK